MTGSEPRPSVVENGGFDGSGLTPTVRKPLGYMAPETTFHHASVFPVTSSQWETAGGSPATPAPSFISPPKGKKSRGPAWKLDVMAITKLHRGNLSFLFPSCEPAFLYPVEKVRKRVCQQPGSVASRDDASRETTGGPACGSAIPASKGQNVRLHSA
jgi:hypothetical protein